MARISQWCVLTLVLKTVADLEQQWLKSQQTNDVSLVELPLADEIVDTSSDGKVVDRAGALAVAKATKYSSAGLRSSYIARRHITMSDPCGRTAKGGVLVVGEGNYFWRPIPNCC